MPETHSHARRNRRGSTRPIPGNSQDHAPIADIPAPSSWNPIESDWPVSDQSGPDADSKGTSLILSWEHLTFEDLITEPPLAPFIISGLIPQDVCLTSATGGTGKSTFELFRSIHVILGLRFFGMPIEQPGPVVYITAEDDKDRIHRRLYKIAEQMDLTLGQRRQVAENFHILNLCGQRSRLAEIDKHGNMQITAIPELIVKDCRQWEPSIIHFDPAARFTPGERFVNDGADALVQALLGISRALKCATHGIQHVSKLVYRDGVIDHLSGRGGAAYGDGARAVYSMVSVDKEIKREAAISSVYQHYIDAGELLLLYITKLSDAKKPHEPFIIRRNGWQFELLAPPTLEHLEEARQQRQTDARRRHVEKIAAFIKEYSYEKFSRTQLKDNYERIGLPRDAVMPAIEEGRLLHILTEADLPKDERKGARKTYITLMDAEP